VAGFFVLWSNLVVKGKSIKDDPFMVAHPDHLILNAVKDTIIGERKSCIDKDRLCVY